MSAGSTRPAAPPSVPDADAAAARLLNAGFVHVRHRHATPAHAWERARAIVGAARAGDEVGAGMPSPEDVGEFTVPPAGVSQRPFQALHIDFGVPIASSVPLDVARFTALHVGAGRARSGARTRIASLPELLRQRRWPPAPALLARLRAYGQLQQVADTYVEGILARLVEAADAEASLPRSGGDGFLCGMEFVSLAEERAFLAARGLDADRVERQVLIEPGELLVFDNLTTAHGRVGVRAPGELHQLCLGYGGLDPARQAVLRDRVLAAFAST